MVTVGGFRSCGPYGVGGVLLGSSIRAARDVARPIVEGEVLERWASEQARLARSVFSDPDQLFEIASVIRMLGGHLSDLAVAQSRQGWYSLADVKELASASDEFMLVQDAAFSLDLKDDISLLNEGSSSRIQGTRAFCSRIHQTFYVDWPSFVQVENWGEWRFHLRTLEGAVIEALCDGWAVPIGQVLDASEASTDQRPLHRMVATRDCRPVDLHVSAVIRRGNSAREGKKRNRRSTR